MAFSKIDTTNALASLQALAKNLNQQGGQNRTVGRGMRVSSAVDDAVQFTAARAVRGTPGTYSASGQNGAAGNAAGLSPVDQALKDGADGLKGQQQALKLSTWRTLVRRA